VSSVEGKVDLGLVPTTLSKIACVWRREQCRLAQWRNASAPPGRSPAEGLGPGRPRALYRSPGGPAPLAGSGAGRFSRARAAGAGVWTLPAG